MKSSTATILPKILQSSSEISYHIDTDFSSLKSVRDEWNALLYKVNGFGYGSYEYCQVWWKHYSEARRLLVFLFRVNGELVGIVPIFHEQLRFGPLRIRVAKLLASDHVYALCDPPILRQYATQIIEIVTREVIENHHCDALCLSPLCNSNGSSEIASEILNSNLRLTYRISNQTTSVNTIFTLPESFDEFLKSLGRKSRYNSKRYWRRLFERFEIGEEIHSEPDSSEECFEEFWKMHRAQWADQGKLGHFGDWPGSLEFHRELVSTQAEMGNCRLYRIIADGQVISIRYGFRFGEHLHSLLPARLVGEQWDRFGIGGISTVRMIKAAIEEGIRTIEAGPGHYPSKLTLGAMECNSQSILITASGASARWRVSVFKCMASVLDKLYYRIYFSRIAPLLPWKPKPLWHLWIRSRL